MNEVKKVLSLNRTELFKMKKLTILVSFSFLAIVLVLAGCSDVKRNPGRVYMPDMAYSRAYETYSPNPIFADGQTNRVPVAGTIKRGEVLPFHIAKDVVGDTTNYVLAKAVKNPLPMLIQPDMVEAERLYLINCGICHGPKLDGNGPLYKGGDGPYPVAPKNLVGDEVKKLADGQIMYSMTYGKNMMGSYASQLDTRQRWMVIHYIRVKEGIEAGSAAAAMEAHAIVGDTTTKAATPAK